MTMRTRYDKKEIHIVGLYVNENDADLNKQLKYYREKRVTRNFEILEKLNSLNKQILHDKLEELKQVLNDKENYENKQIQTKNSKKILDNIYKNKT